MTSLTGLDHEIFIGGDLSIHDNESLDTCEVQSICDYLVNPNGDILIFDNAPGCNSQEEVEEACETVSVEEISPGNLPNGVYYIRLQAGTEVASGKMVVVR